MKILLLAAAFFATAVYGQETDKQNTIDTFPANNGLLNADPTLRVIHVDKEDIRQPPAFFVNGRFVMNQSISALSPNSIAGLDVVKRDTLIEGVLYVGQVYIQMKEEFAPAFISVTELIAKYTDLKNHPVIVTVDGNFVNANYDKYLIDERNMLFVFIDTMNMDDQKLAVGLVKILTKTDANTRNRIMIRGNELTRN